MRNIRKAGSYLLPALALGALVAAQTAPAQETDPAEAPANICLRSNQIDNWEVTNDRTMIVTDRRDNQYKLGLVGTCAGLDNAQFQLGFETLTELSCIRRGDRIHYNDFTFGHERCTISSIEPYVAEEDAAEEAEG
jgi:hypothetical protein